MAFTGVTNSHGPSHPSQQHAGVHHAVDLIQSYSPDRSPGPLPVAVERPSEGERNSGSDTRSAVQLLRAAAAHHEDLRLRGGRRRRHLERFRNEKRSE